MKEFKTILETYRKTDFTERQAALATVVQVKGSSYRSPGARMLMLDNGRWVGSVSGGCLEGDALRKARKVISSGTPQTVTYDTSNDDDNQLGIGLGCNGIIDILIEPIDPRDKTNPIGLLESYLAFDGYGVVATVFESSHAHIAIGEKCTLSPSGEWACTNPTLQQLCEHTIKTSLKNKTHTVQSFDKEGVKVFVEVIHPGIKLLIFGGGFDAKPVTQLASMLGWDVTVSDECVAHLLPVNFPDANQMLPCNREYVAKDIPITPFTAIALMSHNLNYDKKVLEQVVTSDAPYIGILGPKKRAEKLMDHLKKQGITVSPEIQHKLHYPIGIDIGAETPDEIAVSIIAEIQAKFNNRNGGFLRYRTGPIHHKDGKEDQVFRQVYLTHFFPNQQSK